MVTISLKISEIVNIATALNQLKGIHIGSLALSYYNILIKLKKSLKHRVNKAYIQNIIDIFVDTHSLKITTYKKGK